LQKLPKASFNISLKGAKGLRPWLAFAMSGLLTIDPYVSQSYYCHKAYMYVQMD